MPGGREGSSTLFTPDVSPAPCGVMLARGTCVRPAVVPSPPMDDYRRHTDVSPVHPRTAAGMDADSLLHSSLPSEVLHHLEVRVERAREAVKNAVDDMHAARWRLILDVVEA